MREFDEQDLQRRMQALSPKARWAFAASIANRLFPAIPAYLREVREVDGAVFSEALERLWTRMLRGTEITHAKELHDAILERLPSEEDPKWTTLYAYAEDAMAALAFALEATWSSDPQVMIWVARRAYESADQYALTTFDAPFIGAREEQQALQHPVVQTELERQDRDLNELSRMSDANWERLVLLARDRANQEPTIPLGD